MVCQKERSNRMLKNFEKWQLKWQKDLPQFESTRDRINDQAFCKNYKVNSQQAAND